MGAAEPYEEAGVPDGFTNSRSPGVPIGLAGSGIYTCAVHTSATIDQAIGACDRVFGDVEAALP